MFLVTGIVWGIIIFIVLFGDYKGKEIQKHKEEWERIIGEKYYGD